MVGSVLVPQTNYLVYADDDSDDRAILVEMMRRVDPEITLLTMENGLELMQFLDQIPHGERLPGCIVLDMNMPLWDGKKTLEAVKSHPLYQSVPVFLFSTSDNPADVRLASTLGAEAFIVKPFGQRELMQVSEEFAAYGQKPPLLKAVFSAATS